MACQNNLSHDLQTPHENGIQRVPPLPDGASLSMLPLCSLARLVNKEGRGSPMVTNPIWILLDLKAHVEEVLLTGSDKDDLAVAAQVMGEGEQPSLHDFLY